ncbi:MAG: flagellar motor protein MotB [Agriterribacter sp.]
MVRTYVTLLVIGGSLIFTSCGPSKKMRAATARIDSLSTANADLLKLKGSLEDSVKAGQDALKAANDALQNSKTEFETAKTELSKTKTLLTEEQQKMDALRNRLSEELKDFLADGGEVKLENGKIRIEMLSGLLYPSGSAVVNAKGKKALDALAKVLNDYPDLVVNIVGGTDDKPFRRSNNDNWGLSTQRANSVVRILTKKYNIAPTRLVASGKGEFDPVADNSTSGGRAQNRRTEIVINPDIAKVWSTIQ